MRTLAARLTTAALALLAVGGCGGGGGDNNGPGPSSGPMTAVVDGQNWSAQSNTVQAQTVPAVPGGFVIVGSEVDGNTARAITLSLYNIRGTGTYALGVLTTVIGGLATYGEGGGASAVGYVTPFNGHAGTVTLTTLTADRIAGTFSFDAFDNVSTTKHITNGQFDLPLSSGGSLPAVPDEAGSLLRGTIGGDAYNASLVAVTQSGASGLSFTSTSDTLSVTVILNGVTAAGTYPIDFQAGRLISVGRIGGGSNATWGTGNGTTGSVTITSLTATRAKGTFTGNLVAQQNSGATGTIAVTGDFDVGID